MHTHLFCQYAYKLVRYIYLCCGSQMNPSQTQQGNSMNSIELPSLPIHPLRSAVVDMFLTPLPQNESNRKAKPLIQLQRINRNSAFLSSVFSTGDPGGRTTSEVLHATSASAQVLITSDDRAHQQALCCPHHCKSLAPSCEMK